MCFVLTTLSHAQFYQPFQQELDLALTKARWRVGPFRLYPTIQFRDIGYDNNIYRMRENDEPIADFRATISPEIKAYLLYRDWMIFTFTENPEYVFFAKETRERSFNNEFNADLKVLLFRRFVLSGGYGYLNARRRATSEFDVRADMKARTSTFNFFYESASRLSFGFTGQVRDYKFEDIFAPGEEIYVSRQLDREETSGVLEIYYRIHSQTLFFLSGGFSEYVFDYPESKWRDSYSYQVYSGLRFPLLGRMRGTIALGYKQLNPRAEYKKKFSGIVGNTFIDYRVGRFALRFGYNKDVHFSYWTNNAYFIENRYTPGLSFYLNQFIRLDYNFFYGKSRYPEAEVIRLPDEGYVEFFRTDKHYSHTAGFVVRLVRNTGIGLTVNYWRRDSTDFRQNRSRWFVGGFITYEFY